MDEGSWLSWLIVVLLIMCASYFAVSETALASVSRIKIKTWLDKGDRRAKKVLYILDNFDRAITTILICTNVVHIVMATLCNRSCNEDMGAFFRCSRSHNHDHSDFPFGEMLPKSIGKKYSERFSLGIAASPVLFYAHFKAHILRFD
jgi:Mg2+/Co2+ transporter CorB